MKSIKPFLDNHIFIVINFSRYLSLWCDGLYFLLRKKCDRLFNWCSGYHVCLTRRRSQVRSLDWTYFYLFCYFISLGVFLFFNIRSYHDRLSKITNIIFCCINKVQQGFSFKTKISIMIVTKQRRSLQHSSPYTRK